LDPVLNFFQKYGSQIWTFSEEIAELFVIPYLATLHHSN